MIAKATQRFTDLKENKVREVGDEFNVSKERFELLNSKNFVTEVKEVKEVKKVKK